MDVAVTAVLLGLDGLFTVKEEQQTPLKAFLVGKDILLLTDFD